MVKGSIWNQITSREINLNKRCPFVRDPLDDCYCADMNSQKIESAMYYCSGRYEECDIFKREQGRVLGLGLAGIVGAPFFRF